MVTGVILDVDVVLAMYVWIEMGRVEIVNHNTMDNFVTEVVPVVLMKYAKPEVVQTAASSGFMVDIVTLLAIKIVLLVSR